MVWMYINGVDVYEWCGCIRMVWVYMNGVDVYERCGCI